MPVQGSIRSSLTLLALSLAWFGLLPSARAAAPASAVPYSPVVRMTVGGDGGWDYLQADPATQRVFLSRATHVDVVDGGTGQRVGQIPDTPGVHGIALLPTLRKGYTSNGRDNSVLAFDADSLLPLRRIFAPGAVGPDFILADPVRQQVLAFNGRSHNLTIINGRTDEVSAVLALSGKPEGAAIDASGRLFVAIEDRNAIEVIDLTESRRVRLHVVDGCDEAVGVGVDSEHARVFVACHNARLYVLDSDSGRGIAQLPIGEGVDALFYDSATHLVLTSQGDGTLTVIQVGKNDHYSVAQTLPTQRGARTMALDPVSHTVYLVTSEFGPTPAPTKEVPEPRPTQIPGTFTLLVARPSAAIAH